MRFSAHYWSGNHVEYKNARSFMDLPLGAELVLEDGTVVDVDRDDLREVIIRY